MARPIERSGRTDGRQTDIDGPRARTHGRRTPPTRPMRRPGVPVDFRGLVAHPSFERTESETHQTEGSQASTRAPDPMEDAFRTPPPPPPAPPAAFAPAGPSPFPSASPSPPATFPPPAASSSSYSPSQTPPSLQSSASSSSSWWRKGGDALRWARRSVPGPKWPKWAVCSATAVVILAVFSLACIALEEARPRVEGGKKKAAGKRVKKKNKGKKRKKTSKADRRRRKEERRRRDARARRNGAVSGGRRSRRRGD